MPENLDSVGIEFEVEDIRTGNLPDSVERYFTSTHDASCEKDVLQLNCGLIVSKSPKIFSHRNLVLGGEIVSTILDSSDDSYEGAIKDLCGYLIMQGESLESYRAGIHVHICYTNPNLRMLKSVIRLWRYLEDLFYLVGGMGYKFRGVENDATYCRPLTKWGPIIVPTKGDYVESLNVDDLLNSRTSAQFWERFGDMPNQGGVRYFPVRYHGLNLAPMYNRGTLEFRIFNKTLNPLYIIAIINLCKKFCEFSMRTSIDDYSDNGMNVENSVYDCRNKDEISRTFLLFARMCRLDEKYIREIMNIIERTPDVRLSEDRITSHLKDIKIHWRNSSYDPRIVREFRVPNYQDLHVLRGERA